MSREARPHRSRDSNSIQVTNRSATCRAAANLVEFELYRTPENIPKRNDGRWSRGGRATPKEKYNISRGNVLAFLLRLHALERWLSLMKSLCSDDDETSVVNALL